MGAGIVGRTGTAEGTADGLDATTLEANAAMRSIMQRDTGETYDEFLCGLAKASGIDYADPRGPGAVGPEAQESKLEQGMEESSGRGRADSEDEGWADPLGGSLPPSNFQLFRHAREQRISIKKNTTAGR